MCKAFCIRKTPSDEAKLLGTFLFLCFADIIISRLIQVGSICLCSHASVCEMLRVALPEQLYRGEAFMIERVLINLASAPLSSDLDVKGAGD